MTDSPSSMPYQDQLANALLPAAPRIESGEAVAFAFDAARVVDHARSAEVPRFPVESGYRVSDAVQLGNVVITVDGVITATPLTDETEDFEATRHIDTYRSLVEIYERREPMTLVTNLGVYENVVIRSLPARVVGLSVQGQIVFEQVRVIEQTQTALPASAPIPKYQATAPETQDLGAQPTDPLDPVAARGPAVGGATQTSSGAGPVGQQVAMVANVAFAGVLARS